MSRAVLAAAGIAGAAGVGLSAAAAHSSGESLAPAATMLLAHAPALLAIALTEAIARSRLMGFAAATLFAGLLFFCGDIAARHFLGHRLFPMAAPAGGMLLIAGWLLVAVSAVVRRSR